MSLEGSEMIDPETKKEWVRTGMLAGFFLFLALMMLNMMINSAMHK